MPAELEEVLLRRDLGHAERRRPGPGDGIGELIGRLLLQLSVMTRLLGGRASDAQRDAQALRADVGPDLVDVGHALLAVPVVPVCCQPAGTASSTGQMECCSSSLTTTVN